MPTRNDSRRSALRYLIFQMRVGGVPEWVSLDLVPFHADAVFWSDASIKKFVQPYVASCAGHDACEALSQLRLAWTGVTPEARVFALMHVSGGDRGGDTTVEPLWVAFVRTGSGNGAVGTVDALPIREYNRRYTPTLPPPPGVPAEVQYDRPSLSPDRSFYPTYAGLRGVAEWSMSLTGTPMYFLFDPATNSYSPPSTTLPPVVGSQIVIPVHNPATPSDPLIPSGVWLQPQGDVGPVDLAGKADAVFWTSGAIEQFMLPYYASVDGFAGLPDVMRIARAWNGDVPGGGGSIPVTPPLGEGPGRETLAQPQTVYAVVHLPQSAWVTLEESLASAQVALVHDFAGSGRTAVTPVRDFRRASPRRHA